MFNFPPGNLSPGWTERQGVLYSQGIIVCSDSWDLQLPVWIKIFNRRVWFGQKVGPQKPTAVEDQPFLWAALLSLDFKKSRDPNDSSTKVFGNVDQKNELSFFSGFPPYQNPHISTAFRSWNRWCVSHYHLPWSRPSRPWDLLVSVGNRRRRSGWPRKQRGEWQPWLVGGLEPWNFMTFRLLGIILPIDFHIFQRGWNHQPAENGGLLGFLCGKFDKQLVKVGESQWKKNVPISCRGYPLYDACSLKSLHIAYSFGLLHMMFLLTIVWIYIYICNNSICNSHIVVLIVVVIGSISYTEWNVMPCTRICRMNAWPAAWCAWWPLGRWSGGQWLHGYHSPNKNPNGWMIYNGRNGWFGGTSQFRKPPIRLLILLFCFVLSRILSTSVWYDGIFWMWDWWNTPGWWMSMGKWDTKMGWLPLAGIMIF